MGIEDTNYKSRDKNRPAKVAAPAIILMEAPYVAINLLWIIACVHNQDVVILCRQVLGKVSVEGLHVWQHL